MAITAATRVRTQRQSPRRRNSQRRQQQKKVSREKPPAQHHAHITNQDQTRYFQPIRRHHSSNRADHKHCMKPQPVQRPHHAVPDRIRNNRTRRILRRPSPHLIQIRAQRRQSRQAIQAPPDSAPRTPPASAVTSGHANNAQAASTNTPFALNRNPIPAATPAPERLLPRRQQTPPPDAARAAADPPPAATPPNACRTSGRTPSTPPPNILLAASTSAPRTAYASRHASKRINRARQRAAPRRSSPPTTGTPRPPAEAYRTRYRDKERCRASSAARRRGEGRPPPTTHPHDADARPAITRTIRRKTEYVAECSSMVQSGWRTNDEHDHYGTIGPSSPDRRCHRPQIRRPSVSRRPAPHKPNPAGFVEELLSGEVVETPFGKHFETEKLYARHKLHGSYEISDLFELPHDLLASLSAGAIPHAHPTTWAFLDTETTGLAGGSGTYAFLIGVGSIDDCRAFACASSSCAITTKSLRSSTR